MVTIPVLIFAGSPTDPIVKRTYALKDDKRVQLIMLPSSSEQKSAKHKIVLQSSNGNEELVWETLSKQRNGTTASIDCDNDYIQLVAARLDGTEFTVLLSTVLGIDMLRFEKQGNTWVEVVRASVIGSDERFNLLDVLGQGLVMTSSNNTQVIAWVDNDGLVRRFEAANASPNGEAPKVSADEKGSVVWLGPQGQKRVLAGRAEALREVEGTPMAAAANGTLVWVDGKGLFVQFEKLPDPPPPVRVQLKKGSNN